MEERSGLHRALQAVGFSVTHDSGYLQPIIRSLAHTKDAWSNLSIGLRILWPSGAVRGILRKLD